MKKKRKRKIKILKSMGIILAVFALVAVFLTETSPGRKIIYKLAAHYIHSQVKVEDNHKVGSSKQLPVSNLNDIGSGQYPVRHDKDVINILLIGIEEIGGARNTDSMIIASLNTKKNTIKLVSLMRDSYVEIPGYMNNKLNSAYPKGGINLLVDTIEKNYKIGINGYASVNFNDFANIVDLIGGVKVELTKVEADYLNRTNYVSNRKYRNVREGVNILNGNQALGYCRVRHVPTLGNVADDFGRTLRQRRVINQIFKKCTAYDPIKLIGVTKEGLGYITTDLSEDTIERFLEEGIENKINNLDTFRLPVDGAFEGPRKYLNVTYPLVYDWNENIKKLFMYLYGDTETEATNHLAELQQ
ncbi:LCP family protein [Anaeromicropila herbilytica]|uniref:LytR family transcriptional regulator n=1 Tax=Anaeromicropila herbilytica TaxID=2785025 RepID=A0A7R7EIB5_9FIRM|nr:LCP family protein [Anaeromicropila herbilytica]BCN29219.1 LytR family transcriptional regulator [Anaeromicropila herbilytica]